MKRICSFIPERDHALLAAYRMVAAKVPHISMSQIADMAVRSPAPRFYISEEHAAVIMSRMLKGRPLPITTQPTRRRIYTEIFARLQAYLPLPPGITLLQAVAEIVNSPAPEFYVEPKYAIKILNNANIRYNRRKSHR